MPPKIIEEKSISVSTPIKEGDTLTLYCHAEGMPAPRVSWFFREKNPTKDLSLIKRHEKLKQEKITDGRMIHVGNALTIHNISRSFTGIFECIANNSVPPAASRKNKITIECNLNILSFYTVNDMIQKNNTSGIYQAILDISSRFYPKIFK